MERSNKWEDNVRGGQATREMEGKAETANSSTRALGLKMGGYVWKKQNQHRKANKIDSERWGRWDRQVRAE